MDSLAKILNRDLRWIRWQRAIQVRLSERELTLTGGDVSVPGTDPVTEVTFDNGVESDFATRFSSLELDWDLVREPDAVAAGEHVVIPDFAFDYQHSPFRVYFEIMGFWTPEYVAKKLSRLADVDDVQMLVAVDESLGVTAELEARDHRAIPYAGTVRVKDVRDALRRYEEQLIEQAAAALPAELRPEADVVTISTLADEYGVSERAVETKGFPEHERVGRTLVRPAVLEAVGERIESGMELADAETVLDEYGIDDASAALSELEDRVAWDGLSGGTVETK